MNWLGYRMRTIELAVGAWLTLVLVAIHCTVATHAGPLWRDEISSLRLATMPTLGAFWSSLIFDPCPAFYFLLLRCWSMIGLAGTDSNLRLLGCLIGLASIAALWWACWRMNGAVPLWPLLLFALNPIAFAFGDSLRAYGVAVIFIVLSFAAIWDLSFRPLRVWTIVFAIVVAILSVQTLTTNSLMLFAICVAGLSICVWRRSWQRAALILATGTSAAASLLIYLPIFRGTKEWSMLCTEPTSYRIIFASYARALAEGGALISYSWIVLPVIGLVALTLPFLIGSGGTKQDRECQIVFGAIVLIVATAALLIFFRKVGWPTSAWYFLPLMAVSTMSFHAITNAFVKAQWTILPAFAAAVLSLLIIPSIAAQAFVRRTNADLVATAVAQTATNEDFVLVSPYFYAVSFQRYYHGAAPWTALPSVNDYSLHRWDLLKRAMETPDAVANALGQAKATLDAGHTVYLVGGFPPGAASPPLSLGAAPSSPAGWSFQAYVRNWGQQASYVVHQHATHAAYFQLRESMPISPLECLRVLAVSGRKSDPVVSAK
jgi:hypothetical protein